MPTPADSPAPDVTLSWPWREQSPCCLYAGSASFLPAILDSLQAAKRSIDIELYICESSRLLDEWIAILEERARAGVHIRLLADAVGSDGLGYRDRRRLEDAGITLRWFNRLLRPGFALMRDHRKLIIVDDTLAWVGGMGLSDAIDPRVRGERAWFDAMVAMRGPVVADWRRLFDQAWDSADRPPRRLRRWRRRLRGLDQPPPTGATAMARATASRGGLRNPLLYALLRRLATARERVWVNTPYFFPPRRLVAALVRAARRGVKVQLGVAGPCTDHPSFRYAGQHYYSRLLRAGVEIYEYQPCFAHLKAAIVDDWCTVGSCNYDRWNNYLNLDANVEVVDPDFRASLDAVRRDMLAHSERIDPWQWTHRSWLDRARQSFWFWFGVRAMNLLRNPESS